MRFFSFLALALAGSTFALPTFLGGDGESIEELFAEEVKKAGLKPGDSDNDFNEKRSMAGHDGSDPSGSEVDARSTVEARPDRKSAWSAFDDSLGRILETTGAARSADNVRRDIGSYGDRGRAFYTGVALSALDREFDWSGKAARWVSTGSSDYRRSSGARRHRSTRNRP